MSAIVAFAQGNLAAVITAVVVVLASLIHLKYRRSAAFRLFFAAAHAGDVGRIADHLAVDPTRVNLRDW